MTAGQFYNKITFELLTQSDKRFLKSKNGFTLAEILITLVITGVIATITIPTLIHKIQDKEMVLKLKKTYSVLSLATIQINLECDGNIKNCLTNPNAGDNDKPTLEEVATLYDNHLLFMKNCGYGQGCFADTSYLCHNNLSASNYDTADWIYKFLLSDGTSLYINWMGNTNYPFFIAVDLNYSKPPNKTGKDFFYFSYRNAVLVPRLSNSGDCSNPANGIGTSCAERVLLEETTDY